MESVVSLMGLGTFNAWHLEQLQRHETEKILLAIANTHQGQNSAKIVTESLEVVGIRTERVPLPKTDDLNDLHMKARFSGYVDELFSMMAAGVLN